MLIFVKIILHNSRRCTLTKRLQVLVSLDKAKRPRSGSEKDNDHEKELKSLKEVYKIKKEKKLVGQIYNMQPSSYEWVCDA